jgi:hypothetical protein
MNRIFVVVLFLSFSVSLFASSEDLFTINKSNIEQQFEVLNYFEDQVLSTSNSLADLEHYSNKLLNQTELLTGISLVNLSNQYAYNVPYTLLPILLGPAGIATTHKTYNISSAEVMLVFLGVAVIAGAVYLAVLYPDVAAVACSDACGQAAGEIIGEIIGAACAESINNCDEGFKLLRIIGL